VVSKAFKDLRATLATVAPRVHVVVVQLVPRALKAFKDLRESVVSLDLVLAALLVLWVLRASAERWANKAPRVTLDPRALKVSLVAMA